MAVREILQLGNPSLWERSCEVLDIASPAIQALAQDLSDTLSEFRARTGYGRGIAAPQIGRLARVIFIRLQPEGFCGPLFNPTIVLASDLKMELWDDCFSFPDLMVRVSRSVSVRVEYQDGRGSSKVLEAEGPFSELLQHEIDHLDGVLAVQRAVSPYAYMTRAEWERQSKGISTAAPYQ